MDIIAGGVFSAGAFENQMQCDSPALVTTTLNQWIALSADPLGRDYLTLRARIAQRDYVVAPSSSSTRAELQSRSTVVSWGQPITYHWRIVFPPDWVNHGPSSYAVVGQMHDINAPGVGRRPAVAFDVIDNVLKCVMSNTASPLGVTVCDMPISAGQEVSITVHANWADGTNEPAEDGVFRVYFDGVLSYDGSGVKNTWDNGSPSEPNPPYLKCGIYQPNTGDSWWVGKSLTIYTVAAFVAAGFEDVLSCAEYVNSILSGSSIQAIYPAKT